MNLHEYQAKEILGGFGVRIQRGYVASSPEEAVEEAKKLTIFKSLLSNKSDFSKNGKSLVLFNLKSGISFLIKLDGIIDGSFSNPL